jgi:hypothetical protein
MKQKIIASFISVAIVSLFFAGTSAIIGCAKDANGKLTGGLTPTAKSSIKTGFNVIVAAAKTYQAIGEPGLPTQYKPLYDGLTSGAAQLQTQVGQPANVTVINTGSPAVNAALVKNITPGAIVTQADVNTVADAAAQVAPSKASAP